MSVRTDDLCKHVTCKHTVGENQILAHLLLCGWEWHPCRCTASTINSVQNIFCICASAPLKSVNDLCGLLNHWQRASVSSYHTPPQAVAVHRGSDPAIHTFIKFLSSLTNKHSFYPNTTSLQIDNILKSRILCVCQGHSASTWLKGNLPNVLKPISCRKAMLIVCISERSSHTVNTASSYYLWLTLPERWWWWLCYFTLHSPLLVSEISLTALYILGLFYQQQCIIFNKLMMFVLSLSYEKFIPCWCVCTG